LYFLFPFFFFSFLFFSLSHRSNAPEKVAGPPAALAAAELPPP
jgi:hypothetical protein